MPFNNHILHSLLTFSIFSYLQAAPQTTLWLSCSDDSECPTSSLEWPIVCCVAPEDLNSTKTTCRPFNYCDDTFFEEAVSIKAFAMDPSTIKISAQPVPAKPDPAKSDPANSDPAPSVPAKSVLAKSVPAKSVPAKSVPAPSVPAQSDSAIYEYLTKAVTTLSFSDTGDFKKDCLENHNILRHLMGRTTLVWDDKLANQAQIYSKDLANRNAFEHSNKSLKPFGKLGENLYKITNGQF